MRFEFYPAPASTPGLLEAHTIEEIQESPGYAAKRIAPDLNVCKKMKILKIIGLFVLSLVCVFASVQFILVALAMIIAITKSTDVNLSYILGRLAGSIILLLLLGAGIRSLVRSLKRGQPENEAAK